MARRLISVVLRSAVALAFIWISAAAASAKGPDQAVVSGPGIAHPIAVRQRGSSTIGPKLAAMIDASGIMDQLWCSRCHDLAKRQPTPRLGPMYLVRYRIPSLMGGPAKWVDQHVYPFARPRPVTYVEPGQPFWTQGTVGGWYTGGARLMDVLADVGVPRSAQASPQAGSVVVESGVMSTWLYAAVIPLGIGVLGALYGGLTYLARGRSRSRSMRKAHPA